MILISQLKKDGMRQSVPSSNNDIMAAFNGTIYIPYLANQILGMYRKGEIVKISIINRDNADETISLHLNGAISTFTEDKWDKGGWENEEGGEDELN